MYGLTEGYANSTVSDGRLPLEVRRRICGHALPGTELQVVDPRTRAVLPQGEVGELRIRGYITPGYCKNPQLTAQAIDEQGWFYTGDLAMLDPTGGLELKGRLKEMIKTGGISVTPADVEYLLLQVPGVVQAIVVGVPDPQRDEAVAAMVVLEAGSSVTEADLVDHVRRSAAVYKVPRLIEIVPGSDVPLTLTGKVHKDGVQQRLGALYAAANQA
jgi:fatty-acyl-CoA synthase